MFNPLIPVAKLSATRLTFPDEARQTIYTSAGTSLPPETSCLLYESIWKYADEAIEYSADPRENIHPEWSVYDFCLARIREDDTLDINSKYIAFHMVELLTTFTAVDIRKQSLRHYQVEAVLPVRLVLRFLLTIGGLPFCCLNLRADTKDSSTAVRGSRNPSFLTPCQKHLNSRRPYQYRNANDINLCRCRNLDYTSWLPTALYHQIQPIPS